ncbi:carbohydrate ABC transporter permease [Pseudonocardia sp. TRM90224]|uniref:carbohydrate ABC transporter permease n=1 Tax=Pseudonocardia sp. TRM90224 TaxID=2812678 RepID=UPI001E4E93DD|nr:carbohydrate ABC transporter permease [Pseudonocardia sp. TRM90224]
MTADLATRSTVPAKPDEPPLRPTAQRLGPRGIFSQVLLTLVLLLFLLPFIWMLSNSVKPGDEVFSSGLLGSEVRLGNYGEALAYLPFGRFMLNGLFVSISGTIVVCVTSVLAAYAFSRLRFRGRGAIFMVYLATLMVPHEVTVVPLFILMQQLGWVNSYAALIFPWAFSAFGTFLLRQFFLSIPQELEEAAVIDGASKLRILVQVIVPIARPAIAVLAVFTFINYWNSYLWPLIIINSQEKATIPLGLSYFLSQNGNEWHLLMAGCAIAMAPTVLMVVLLQKHLIRGIAISGIGGR